MRTKWTQALAAVLLVLVALGGLAAAPVRAALAAPSAYDLIAAVNALRQSHGVAALKINSALMSSAQGHSNYQASIGTWTHTGSGGSTPTSRGIVAGFGGGASVFISENIAYQLNTYGVDYIIYTIWSDAIHWNTMLDPKFTAAGAGVAAAGAFSYYTLDVGQILGQASSRPQNPAIKAQVQQPTVQLVAPVLTSTPKPDGSIIHPVQFGQALLTIAKAYGLTVDELKKRNNLSGDTIFEGQKLVIRGSFTPTLTPTITLTPLPPTRTPQLTRTATLPPTDTAFPTVTETATPRPFLDELASIDRTTLAAIILGISGVGLLLVLASFFRKKKT